MENKRGLIISLLIFMIVLVLVVIVCYFGYLLFFSNNKEVEKDLENPMQAIINREQARVIGISDNTLETGNQTLNQTFLYNETRVINEGIVNFSEDYISYLLITMGVGNLHSAIGFGNPIIEFNIDNESWNSELVDSNLNTKKNVVENEDLRIFLTREEAVKALISPDATQFMKDSVKTGKTKIEMIAGKPTLFAKGYLGMYKELTGKEAEI